MAFLLSKAYDGGRDFIKSLVISSTLLIPATLNHESEPLDLEPPDECELGTQRWRLDDIRRTPDAAVKRHDEPPTLSNHLLQARDSAIDLPPFVVADDDAVETEIRCPLGVVNPLDSFDEEGPCRR
ncbi:hypothetical protein VdG1_07767 [Verticillium dahliae VDG1]|nr:hypothetical protein VdG1_07767 [Verticillium dahliae VDG1]